MELGTKCKGNVAACGLVFALHLASNQQIEVQ